MHTWSRHTPHVVRAFLLVAAFVWVVAPAAANELPADLTVRMELYPSEGGPLKYVGERTATERDGVVEVVTRFSKPDGTLVQTTHTRFDQKTLALIAYRRFDQRTGVEHIMERKDGKVLFRIRESADEPFDTGEMDWASDMIYSQTVARYAFRHIESLIAGKTLVFELLAAERKNAYDFRMVRDRDAEREAPQFMWMRMEPDNWLIRQLVDPMYFLWEPGDPPVLREYHGRSSIRTDDGHSQDLRYVYLYDQ